MENSMNLEDGVITKNSGFLASEIDGEVVLMNVENGKYFGMNSIGSEIWRIIEKPSSLSELTSKLLSDYDVDNDLGKRDISNYINHLLKENLIQIVKIEKLNK